MRLTHFLLRSLPLLGIPEVARSFTSCAKLARRQQLSITCLFIDNNDNNNSYNPKRGDENNAWDANVDYDKEWPQEQAPPDPSTAWDALPSMPESPKLGVDVSLEPFSEEQAAAIKKEAEDIINSAIDEGIQDIEKLRVRMAREMEQSRKMMQMTSELEAKKMSEELMEKIDKITDNFLSTTAVSRKSTKMAAAASRAMEGTGRGIEMGTWGTISGRTVVASESSSLLGSIENAVKQQEKTSKSTKENTNGPLQGAPVENRILVVADTKQDQLAKQLLPELETRFVATDIPNCSIEILSPSSSMPLGGNNAACVLVFCTSLSQSSSLTNILDKLLRKTFQSDGLLGRPPTQLVGISTLGTERSDKFPYSMANLLGKLDQRRQIEEVLVNAVQRRESDPPLDFTLIKIGVLKGSAKEFNLRPGDALDDPTTAETAARTIVQAVAYQPFARNSTLSVSGAIPEKIEDMDEGFWDKSFLCLEGPEVLRLEGVGDVSLHRKLVEYIQGWAEMLAETGKGLTTPVQSIKGIKSRSSHLMKEQDGVELLFLPTKTGKYYMSKEEERKRESVSGKKAGTAGGSMPLRSNVREGGIDVVVEVTKDDQLRVRARRCNYADDTVIKELSESTILGRLEDAMDVWKRELL